MATNAELSRLSRKSYNIYNVSSSKFTSLGGQVEINRITHRVSTGTDRAAHSTVCDKPLPTGILGVHTVYP